MHGADDGCMGVELARMAAPFMPAPGSFVEIIDDAGHFFHVEQPKLVNDLIVKFVT
jgi:pimeloyl-ACP methyl ester carboxylesterase